MISAMRELSTPRFPAAPLQRFVLLASALSLAAYIVYKLATQLHATQGIYFAVFPLSSLLAAAGIVLATQPQTACSCSKMTRFTMGALAAGWAATGLVCSPALVEAIGNSPAAGLFATLHMLVQHVLLSGFIIAFALWPREMAERLGTRSAKTAQTPRLATSP